MRGEARARGRVLVDVAGQRWVAVIHGGRACHVVARHAVVATRRGDEWERRAAPFVGAFDAAEEEGRLWVATEGGWLCRWLDDGWSSLRIEGLERVADGRLLAEGGRRWIVRRGRLHEITERGLRSLGPAPAVSGPVTRTERGLVFSDGSTVNRFSDGAFEALFRAAGAGGRVWAAAAADGESVWILDDAGALFRLDDGGRLEPLRAGRISRWKRHTYPDPDPDDFDDRVLGAAISAHGEVVTWRFYDHGSRRTWKMERTPLEGEAEISEWTGTARDLGLQSDLMLAFDERQPAPPAAIVIDALEPERASLRVGDERGEDVWVSTPGGADPAAGGADTGGDAAALRVTRDPVRFSGETWSGIEGRIVIEGIGEPVEHELGAPFLAFLVGDDRPPIAVDRSGQQHDFDGATFRATPAGVPIEGADHVVVLGDAIRLADRARVVELPRNPSRRRDPVRDVERVGGRLRSGVADLIARAVPIPRAEAMEAMRSFRALGRTAAGLALAALWAGDEDAPGPADHAALAASVMAGFADRTEWFALEREGALVAWVAVLDEHAVVTTDRRDAPRVAAALRAPARD